VSEADGMLMAWIMAGNIPGEDGVPAAASDSE
jgi:hypothetical protein